MSENTFKPSALSTKSDASETAWTVMVYLAGDNNLADECVYALTEMKAAMTDPRIRVVAQFDPTARRVKTRRFVLNGNGTGSSSVRTIGSGGQYRSSILEDEVKEGLPPGRKTFPGAAVQPLRGSTGDGAATATAPVGADVYDTDSGDPKLLFDFISWTVDNYPADHYMVILSGHGSGVTDQEFLRDDSSKGTLTIKELGEVFKAVRSELKDKRGVPLEIDLLGLDTCVMSMAEVCFELAGSVRFMVSSESFGPQSGWPYGRILERLSKHLAENNGETTSEQLAGMVIDEHVDFYLEYAATNGLSVDISLMDADRAGDLVDAVKDLSTVLIEALKAGETRKKNDGYSEFLDQIVLAHWEAQSYNGELYVDLLDFCQCLLDRYSPNRLETVPSGDPREAALNAERDLRVRVGEALTNVINLIRSALVLQSCYMGVAYQYSYGVSIYFPWAEVALDYNEDQLAFVTPSGWREFLDEYVTKTRREPRGSKVNAAKFARLDESVRRTPTDQKGPADVLIRSMRNPPIEVVKGGVSDCTQARQASRLTS